MSALNKLNLPINPQPNTNKGENWLDIAWFSINGQSYVYVRSDDYTGAETCYAFVDETLASYTLNTDNTLLLELETSSITYDVEAGLYDDTFSTSYNHLFDTTNGVITNPTVSIDVSTLALDGDCLLGELINQATPSVYDLYEISLDSYNDHIWNSDGDFYQTAYYYTRDFLCALEDVGDTSTLTGIGGDPSYLRAGYIIANMGYVNTQPNPLYDKFVLLKITDNIGSSYEVEVIETNFSGKFASCIDHSLGSNNDYLLYKFVYSNEDTDNDGTHRF